jgi:FMN-dependent NADH-azoreductase
MDLLHGPSALQDDGLIRAFRRRPRVHIATMATTWKNGRVMNILQISCSPRGQAAESYRLSRKIIEFLRREDPNATLVHRVLGAGAIGHIDGAYASALGATRPTRSERFPAGSMAVSELLIREVEAADCVVIATPMHNFTIPSSLKAWIDHIVRVRRTFDVTRGGKVAGLRDRPIYFAVSSGGRYSGQGARQPDFLTPYLKAVLATVGLHDLHFFSVEGTALGLEAVAAARARADQALREHFATRALVPAPQ